MTKRNTRGGLVIEQIAYHRNGSGAPFHVVKFSVPAEERRMVAVVFDEPQHVAVFDRALLARDVIAFFRNSWRGDYYERDLRDAIAVANSAEYNATLGLRGLLYEREGAEDAEGVEIKGE